MQPRASTGLYPRTSSRIFRSEVAEVFRSLPKLVVERMVDNLDLSSLSLLEDAILNIGGHLRSRMATLKQEEILKRQGKGFGTATVPRPHTSALPYICSNPGCGGRFASSQRTRCFLCSRTVRRLLMDPPAKWLSISESFKEDFKYRYGRPQTDYERKLPQQEQPGGRGPYSPAELTAMMEDQTGKGLLFASGFSLSMAGRAPLPGAWKAILAGSEKKRTLHLVVKGGPRPPAFLLGHPENPAKFGSWWATSQCKGFFSG